MLDAFWACLRNTIFRLTQQDFSILKIPESGEIKFGAPGLKIVGLQIEGDDEEKEKESGGIFQMSRVQLLFLMGVIRYCLFDVFKFLRSLKLLQVIRQMRN